MSATTTSFHAHSLAPSSTPTEQSSSTMSNGSSTSSNTLYLYTFLTTLLLLLAVSCGIIFRSFVLRRRFRQRVEEAIAAGVLLPDGRLAPGMSGGRRGFDFGAKPVMHEVWMEHHSGSKGEKWEDIKPVSATVVRNSVATLPITLDLPTPASATQPHGRFNPRTLVQNFRSFGFGAAGQRAMVSQSTLGASTPRTGAVGSVDQLGQLQPPSPNPTSESSGTSGASDNLILSVLIAMPNPSRPAYIPSSLQPPLLSSGSGIEETLSVKGKSKVSSSPTRSQDEEEELPDVVFGVSELLWTKEMEVPESPSPSAVEDKDAERRV